MSGSEDGYIRYREDEKGLKGLKPRISWISADGTPQIALPHQCDDWVIGNIDDAKALIADLQALIDAGAVEEET
jgi:hypothetical protein